MTGYLQAYEAQHLNNGRGLRAMMLDRLDNMARSQNQIDRHALFLPRILSNAGLNHRPLTVMDIGIGNGYPLSYDDPQITKYGVDLSTHFEDELKKCNINLIIADAGKEKIPMPDGSFDLVMLNHLIEHVHDYHFLMTEVRRLLKPGGICLIRTPDFEKTGAVFYSDYTHVKPYTHAGLRHMATSFGFEIIKTLQSDHMRIQFDILTHGKFESLFFNHWFLGGKEIETYWRKPAEQQKATATGYFLMPDAFMSPSTALASAWEKFIKNDNNCGHAERGYVGSNLASHLVEVWKNNCKSAARVALQTARLLPQNILDLGASVGGLSLALCAQYPAATVHALEPEPEAFATLTAMQTAIGEARLKTYQGTGESLPFADASMDLIVCHTVLEHVRDPEKVLLEMYRVLRPGGMVHLELPNYIWPIEPHVHSFFIPFAGKSVMKALGRLQGLSTAEIKFMDHLQLITKPQLEHILRKTGFDFYNLAAEKIFMCPDTGGHHVHSNWKKKLLRILRSNMLGKLLLRMILALGLYSSLLYRLQKPLR